MPVSNSETLTDYFRSAGFTETQVSQITAVFKARMFRKGDLVLTEGMPCQQLGFVETGLYMAYLLVKGEERTTYVISEGGFLASLWSFLKDTPSQENIRCVADGKVWFITKTDLQRLLREVSGFDNFYTAVLENEICCVEESRYDLIALTAEERYQKLLQKTPHLLQQIPLQYLATLLGVTPRHLSRIRSRAYLH